MIRAYFSPESEVIKTRAMSDDPTVIRSGKVSELYETTLDAAALIAVIGSSRYLNRISDVGYFNKQHNIRVIRNT